MFTKTAAIFALASFAGLASAQPDGPMPPLAANPTDTNQTRLMGKAWPYHALPHQVDTTNGVRGPQYGYNDCSNATAGPDSKCQTLIVNSVQDFCLFAPPKMGTVGDTEGENVAVCSQNTHGARVMPPGALQGVQFTVTKSYVQVVGFINQTLLNIQAGDEGGELDSGGQDLRGNPIGAQVYSTALPGGNNQMTQSRMWHMFTGSNMFCMKLCTEQDHNASGHCRHTLDTIGCYPSNPADYDNIKGKFLSCQGDDMGSVTADSTEIPKSSNCVQFESASIYPSATNAPPPPGATATGAPVASSGGAAPTSSGSAASGGAAPSGSAPASSGTGSGASTGTIPPGHFPAPSSGSGTASGHSPATTSPAAGGAANDGASPSGSVSNSNSNTVSQGSGSSTPINVGAKPTTTQPLTASPSQTGKPGNGAVSVGASSGVVAVAALVAAAFFA